MRPIRTPARAGPSSARRRESHCGAWTIFNQLTKEYTMSPDSGRFAFLFAASDPTVRYEVSGAVAGLVARSVVLRF
jgi:hypothetical protein